MPNLEPAANDFDWVAFDFLPRIWEPSSVMDVPPFAEILAPHFSEMLYEGCGPLSSTREEALLAVYKHNLEILESGQLTEFSRRQWAVAFQFVECTDRWAGFEVHGESGEYRLRVDYNILVVRPSPAEIAKLQQVKGSLTS